MHDDNAPDDLFAIINQGTPNYTLAPTMAITPTPATAGVRMQATCTLTAGKVTSITIPALAPRQPLPPAPPAVAKPQRQVRPDEPPPAPPTAPPPAPPAGTPARDACPV